MEGRLVCFGRWEEIDNLPSLGVPDADGSIETSGSDTYTIKCDRVYLRKMASQVV